MLKDIVLVGAGGFGREVLWILEENKDWNILGFIDGSDELTGKMINGYPILGTEEWLVNCKSEINAVICIGNPKVRKAVVDKISVNTNIKFPNIIANDVRFSKHVEFGVGNIICSSSILTVNIKLGDFNIINLSCTIGHDVNLHNYITVYPGVNISGNVEIGNETEIGTGTKIIQGLLITNNVITGAGAVVVKDLTESGTYIGVPVKKIR